MLRWYLSVPLFVSMLCKYKDSIIIHETHRVKTLYGPVVGQYLNSDTVNFMAFKGIPYAKPPTGELRFRAPEPPDKWTTTKKATKFGSICPQADKAPGASHEELGNRVRNFIRHAPNYAKVAMQLLSQSEDCLTLNVYTLPFLPTSRRPVLVWFHGGGFYSGESTDALYGPEYLVEQDLVVVTVNYRLGVLGFLSTNTPDTSGNWGLKDQVAALKWVRDNIVNFGGDPNRVTIYGESAGAACVHYHLLSPLSKGLFHKAIMSSGAATSDWALNQQPERLARNLARLTGAREEVIADPSLYIQHLRKVDEKGLIRFMWHSMDEKDSPVDSQGFIPFVPVIEPPGTPGAFLTEDPKVIMEEGRYNRVPVMMGFNDLDGGVLFTGPTNYSTPKQLQKEDIDVCLYLPKELKAAIDEKNECAEVAKMISNIYFGGKSSSSSPLGFVKFFGDRAIIHYIYVAQKWFTQHDDRDNPLYFYYFKYDGEWNLVKDFYSINLPGVTHWDELVYVFKQKIKTLAKLAPQSPGYITHKRMISFINNFVRYGSPTAFESTLYIPWEPANATDHNTMIINADLKMRNDLLDKRMDFWNRLYQHYIPSSYSLVSNVTEETQGSGFLVLPRVLNFLNKSLKLSRSQEKAADPVKKNFWTAKSGVSLRKDKKTGFLTNQIF